MSRTLSVLLVIYVIICGQNGRAQGTTQPAQISTTKQRKPSKQGIRQPASQTSESWRGIRKFGIGPTFGSAGNGVIECYGAETFYNASSRFQIGLVYVQGSYTRKSLETSNEDPSVKGEVYADATTRVAKLHGNIFLGNSFAISIGAGYRLIDWKLGFDAEDSSTTATASAEGTGTSQSLLAHVGIANYWTYDTGIFLGVNWLGYAVPVATGYRWQAQSAGLPPASKEIVNSATETSAIDLSEFRAASSFITVGYQF